MKFFLLLISFMLLFPVNIYSASQPVYDMASDITTDTDNFGSILSSADDNVQKSLDTIDDMTIGDLPGTLDNISEGTTNKHLTTTLKSQYDDAYTYRLTGITDNITGLDISLSSNNISFSITSGYVIPTTTEETNWNTAYSTSHTQGTDSSVNSSLSGVLFATSGTLSTKAIGTDIQAYSANTTLLGNTTTGSGSIVLSTSPTFTTQITTPKIYNAGDITIDAYNASADSTVTFTNSDGTYDANVSIDGDLTVKNIDVQSGGVLQLGQDGVDGELRIYSEQGGTDYIAHLFANTAMTSSANFYLPADEPASTSLLKMTTGGVMGYATAGTDYVLPSGDITGKSASTDALNSATTTVNVSSATAPSSGQVLTATSSTAATWQTPSSSGIPKADASGTVDTITADFSPDISLTDKTLVAVVAAGANTSTTPTFAPDGLTAHTIVKQGGQALLAGDIPAAGFVMLLEYNLANTRWELLNPRNVADSITDGVTNSAPSQNAVFDALALKATEGAWTDYSSTSTITGWSSFGKKYILYKKIGNLLYVRWDLDGISNATSATFTLPYSSVSSVGRYGAICNIYSGGWTWGSVCVEGLTGWSKVAIYNGGIGTAWASSGNKASVGEIILELAS